MKKTKYIDREISDPPYLFEWWKRMLGLAKNNGKYYVLTDE